MLIRILKPVAGIVQGISLASLKPGVTYDVDASLGGYLVTIGTADAVASSSPAMVIPLDRFEEFSKALGASVTEIAELAEAADKPRRKARRTKGKRGPKRD